MIAPSSISPGETITSALAGFFARGKIGGVFFVRNATQPPPPLSYFLHIPRLSLTLSGEESVRIARDAALSELRLAKGRMLLVPPNCWTQPLWKQPATTLTLLFGTRQIGVSLVRFDGDSPAPPQAQKTVLQGAATDPLQNIINALLTLPPGDETAPRLLAEALLRSVLAILQSTPSVPQRRAHALYQEICLFVQEHAQTNITRDSVASYFRLSPNHISRLFKNEGSISFNDYVNYTRVNRAKALLKEYRQSVDEVAAACGYSETSYFCRVFKKTMKVTPSVYRQTATQTATVPSAPSVNGI
jgi:AraC-like DNA-binding protein